MKYCIYADIHLFAPHAIYSEEDLIDSHKEHGQRCLLLGDIVDISNCKNSQVIAARMRIKKLKELFGRHYILGNHECQEPERYYLKVGKLLFCHGHTLYYTDEKVKKWENKKGGRSNLKYAIYRLKHIGKKEGKKLNLSKSREQLCIDLMKKHGCNTIVFGHTHRKCDYIPSPGYRIVGVPRGKTIIDL